MSKTEFKYGDVIPADVKTLKTLDGDLTFVRDGKRWKETDGRWGIEGYDNSGSLLWEWAQTNPLVAPKSKLEQAKEYFAPLSTLSIEIRLRDSAIARDHAAEIIRSC